MARRKGSQDAAGMRFGLVVARFNQAVTSKLRSSCLAALKAHGASGDDLEVVRVPGAFELPLVARLLAKSGRFDAVICLGAVIRGDTPHFEYICAEASRGIGQVALETGVPVVFGVLTTNTVAQAVERADPTKFNRGGEAAVVAIEMGLLAKRLAAKTVDVSGPEPRARRAGTRRGR